MTDPSYLPYGQRPASQQNIESTSNIKNNNNINEQQQFPAYLGSSTGGGGGPLYAQVAGAAGNNNNNNDARKPRFNTVQGLPDSAGYGQMMNNMNITNIPGQHLSDRSLPNVTASGLPGYSLQDFNMYAAALAGMGSGNNNAGPTHGSSNSIGGIGSGTGQGQGQGYAPSQGSSQASSLHQRTMSAMAGLGQGIGQQYGQSDNTGIGYSHTAGAGAGGGNGGLPQYGMVGPAGLASSPQQPFSGSPITHLHSSEPSANSVQGQGQQLPTAGNAGAFMSGSSSGVVGPGAAGYAAMAGMPTGLSGSNPLPNMASPAAQAMSAMSSLSGLASSSNTSGSAMGLGGTTPISPATVYTPNFTSPSLSQQAAFNAAAAAGLGVGGINFGAFGLPNMPLGGLGIASIPMGSPSISQQMSNMSLSQDGMQYQGSRTVYVGNLPGDASVDELLSQVRYGPIENVKIIPDKSCAFVSFLDPSTAAAFHSDANLRKVQLHGQDLKIGWGKPTGIPAQVIQAVQQHGATRNVYLGNLDETYTEQTLRDELSKFGHIDQVKIVRDKNIGFVHFLSISTAMKVVSDLPREPEWQGRRVNYGKDRCAYVPRNQHQQQLHNQLAATMAQQAATQAMSPFNPLSPAIMPPMSPVMSPMAFQGGFDPTAMGNRTVYLGNLHPDTTAEDVCNTIRGGILQEVRHMPDKHICFVTFVMAESALALMNTALTYGINIKNRRLKVGWGKNHGPCPPGISAIVAAGGSRNVYIGNIDDFVTITADKIKQDLAEYGEIEQVNLLEEKSCAFTNFTKISSAVKAIEGLKAHSEYGRFKIAYGKDRVGNMARTPPTRRPHHYHRDNNQQGFGSSQAHHSDDADTPDDPITETTLSPQLDAAVHAAAAVEQIEQSQGIKPAQ